MLKILNGLDKLSLANFRKKADLIVNCMTGNAFFPDEQPDIQLISTKVDAYKKLDDAASDRGGQAVLKRDIARNELITKLRLLGNDVLATAKNDVEKLASSGFDYSQPRKTSPDLPKPNPPILGAGVNPGEMYCQTSRKPGMTGVNFYHTTDVALLGVSDSTGWDIVSTNKVKTVLNGLMSGQRYYIKVGLVGVRGQEVISNPVSYIPQ